METDAEFLSVSVADTGIGIKEEDHDKIFKLFGMIKDVERQINT